MSDLQNAVDRALSDLECADLKCWCFTRDAMGCTYCQCANCQAWRALRLALEASIRIETTPAA